MEPPYILKKSLSQSGSSVLCPGFSKILSYNRAKRGICRLKPIFSTNHLTAGGIFFEPSGTIKCRESLTTLTFGFCPTFSRR